MSFFAVNVMFRKEMPQYEEIVRLPIARQVYSVKSSAPMAKVYSANEESEPMTARNIKVYDDNNESCCFCCFRCSFTNSSQEDAMVDLIVHSIIR